MIMKYLYILIFIFFLPIFHIHGQEHKLYLENAIHMANDSSIRAFQLKKQFLYSFWEYKNYRAQRLPALSLDLVPIQYNQDIVQRYVSELNRDEYRTQQSLYSYGNLSLTQNVDFTGGTFYIESALSFFRNIGQSSTDQFSTVPIRLGYSQSLIGYNPFKWEKKIEPLKFKLAKKELVYNLEDIAITVTSLFFDLALAKCDYEQSKRSLEICKKLYNEGIIKRKHSAVTDTELLSLEIAVLDAKNACTLSENAKRKAVLSLSSFLKISLDNNFDIVIPDSIPIGLILKDMALSLTRSNHPVYYEQKKKILEVQKDVDKARKERFGNTKIDLSVGFNQISDNFYSAYNHPLQQNTVSVGVSIPIVDWGIKKGNYKMALNNQKIVEYTAEQEIIAVEQNIMSLVDDYNAQVQVWQTSRKSVDLAVKITEETILRFNVGKDKISVIQDCLMKEHEVKINFIKALSACWLSFYKICQMTFFDFSKKRMIEDCLNLQIMDDSFR